MEFRPCFHYNNNEISLDCTHCKPGQVEAAYIECGNSAVAMQVSQVNLFELDLNKLGPVQISSLDYLQCYSGCQNYSNA